jgi:aldose 1-epimerase
VAFAATGRWEMGADKLPTHRVPSSGLQADGGMLDVDHCFDGWHGDVVLTDGLLRTRISANLSRLVVFTQPSRDAIAIEPVSHVNNALQLAGRPGLSPEELGLKVLAPGESFSATLTIQTETVA